MVFWNIYENLCLKSGKKPNPVGKELGISSGTISQWKTGSIPSGEKLLQIAEYFNVSVDYLLGRTDNPNSCSENSISNVETTITGTQANIINNGKKTEQDSITTEFIRMFESLPIADKIEIMNSTLQKAKKIS